MRHIVTLSDHIETILKELMAEDITDNVSGFFRTLLIEEYKHRQDLKNRRPQGRPRKGNNTNDDNDNDDFPDEYAPKTKAIPPHLQHFVFPLSKRKELVNDFDILMLDEKRKAFEAQNR